MQPALAWVTLTVTPAILRVPLRGLAAVLAVNATTTAAPPEPVVGESVIQESDSEAVHAQPSGASSSILCSPLAAGTLSVLVSRL